MKWDRCRTGLYRGRYQDFYCTGCYGIPIARDLLSRSLFSHLIAIRSLEGSLSHSLFARLIPPYKYIEFA